MNCLDRQKQEEKMWIRHTDLCWHIYKCFFVSWSQCSYRERLQILNKSCQALTQKLLCFQRSIKVVVQDMNDFDQVDDLTILKDLVEEILNTQDWEYNFDFRELHQISKLNEHNTDCVLNENKEHQLSLRSCGHLDWKTII